MEIDGEHRHMVNAAPIEVACVPILSDNYVWLLHDPAAQETVAIDPGEAAPVLAAAQARGWSIGQVWLTHWHKDHSGGAEAIRTAQNCPVAGPKAEAGKLPRLDRALAEGDVVTIGRHQAGVIEVPGHTAGHIAFHFADAGLLFPGDTLFAMGCGRLFEGTPGQMFASLAKLAAMPAETVAYPAHEYTASNGRFARTVEPENEAIVARMKEVERLRGAGDPTLPTTIGLERETNPFLRAQDPDRFAELRAAKDSFLG